MNIKKELLKAEHKNQTRNTIKKAFMIIRNLLCQHKDLYQEFINVELGNCSGSLLEEIIGDESKKSQKMKLRIVRCANCGREIERDYVVVDEEQPQSIENKG